MTEPRSELREELTKLINRHSLDNQCETPDYILADFFLQTVIPLVRINGMSREALVSEGIKAAISAREAWLKRNDPPNPYHVTRDQLALPLIHLNGTSGEALVGQFSDAYCTLCAAREHLNHTHPNARDYYAQGQGEAAYAAAVEQHQSRVHRLNSVIKELNVIREALRDDLDSKRTRL